MTSYALVAERPKATVCKTVKPSVQIRVSAPGRISRKILGNGNGLENRRSCGWRVGSNPTSSAILLNSVILPNSNILVICNISRWASLQISNMEV